MSEWHQTFIRVLKRASRPDGRCTVKCMLLQKGAVNYCGCISWIEGAYIRIVGASAPTKRYKITPLGPRGVKNSSDLPTIFWWGGGAHALTKKYTRHGGPRFVLESPVVTWGPDSSCGALIRLEKPWYVLRALIRPACPDSTFGVLIRPAGP